MSTSLVSQDVKIRFGSKEVLRGFSFEARPSDIVFIAGRNGAGKTTWIRIATGLMRSTSGRVSYNGHKTVSHDGVRLSVVFDEPPVYPTLTGKENLRALAGLNKFDGVAKATLDSFQLDPAMLKIKAGHYSYGQKHRLSMAAAMLRQPTHLFLDEPADGLDPVAWGQVEQGIRSMASGGATVVLTGQDFDLVESLASRVVVLHEGITAFEGPPGELIGKFPPSIFVRADDVEAIKRMFPDARRVDQEGSLLEIVCASDADLEQAALKLQRAQTPLKEMYVRKKSLKEAFLETIGGAA
ncbi:MAG: ABC transporter ATP-binding protein [Actinobacteria bacterium]|nr:ABC transporter ATP-binding protein [Actinomycetota bacterium]MCL5886745.1 ABC transporter ATP-binding protein [Actinomycetota bacterium]